ncbi:protein-export membrane protein SecD [Candidatus Woesebacteria bacterium RIFOXYC1_FULL_41_14]|uniref:Protein translocase subunit SecD n=2 Tax=Candidatus Woeseibacteriota TaxID=1752722 RepID=A0A1F8CY52_9BACT|nr:MAG: Preprotein translocase subunit SecD [Candidatus Woesebacteria bacterium GW2011_GWE1_41_24]OGM81250.1 MAG: protein-export membrane protein SecD [Candidatus Woesebacteria bacterium RIFOXYB1_FULL_41_13]OGM84842.1 MAG: protein-export membrane protein SecD [Candidatus Woesebacteria bacterium RIFOXYC1_FULL_41_14]
MLRTPVRKSIFVAILTLAAAFVSLPQSFTLFGKSFTRPDININIGKFSISRNLNTHLGLDLAGGSRLVFEANTGGISEEKKIDALTGVRNVIENRVNMFGISESTVQTSNFEGRDRIIVELPGISDTESAIKLIGETAQLSFVEVVEEAVPGSSTPSASLVPTDLTGADLERAEVVFDSNTGEPTISIQFSEEGGKKFAEITKRNVGKQLPIILDNRIISAPTVQEQIIGNSAQISGSFTIDEAKELSIQLNAGALPVPVELIQQETIGATLGAESVKMSVVAGIVGLLMVGLFMILSYGKLGLIADVGLFVFSVITMALYKLIPITLTLPGIAGFMLSIGMAVDSNILIFERFKEEKLKRNISDALEVSFGRAWDSIRDANVATIITSLILMNPLDWSFLPSSGPVRGFAITLLMGVLISLFTGIYVSRNLLRVFVREKKEKKK